MQFWLVCVSRNPSLHFWASQYLNETFPTAAAVRRRCGGGTAPASWLKLRGSVSCHSSLQIDPLKKSFRLSDDDPDPSVSATQYTQRPSQNSFSSFHFLK